jgi:Putative MetA-pathway of phenol degradation
VFNLGIILIFAAAAAAPSPSPAPPADPCGGLRTNLLAALDRPSIGYSACAVKRGETIVEAGYSNLIGSTGAVPSYPQGLVRAGAARNLEVDAIAGGTFDSGFGAKYEFWHDGRRALAADFLYTMPTGTIANSAGAPVQTLNLDYGTPISGNFGLAITLGGQSSFAGRRFYSWVPSAVISDQWSPRAQAFVEAFGQSRTRPGGSALFGMDAAFQYLLTPAFEVDVEVGRTLTDTQRVHYAGFGFGARL